MWSEPHLKQTMCQISKGLQNNSIFCYFVIEWTQSSSLTSLIWWVVLIWLLGLVSLYGCQTDTNSFNSSQSMQTFFLTCGTFRLSSCSCWIWGRATTFTTLREMRELSTISPKIRWFSRNCFIALFILFLISSLERSGSTLFTFRKRRENVTQMAWRMWLLFLFLTSYLGLMFIFF